jgi:hypothetical protein
MQINLRGCMSNASQACIHLVQGSLQLAAQTDFVIGRDAATRQCASMVAFRFRSAVQNSNPIFRSGPSFGDLEKLISLPIGIGSEVNASESKREQSGIIRRQFRGIQRVVAIFRGPLLTADFFLPLRC